MRAHDLLDPTFSAEIRGRPASEWLARLESTCPDTRDPARRTLERAGTLGEEVLWSALQSGETTLYLRGQVSWGHPVGARGAAWAAGHMYGKREPTELARVLRCVLGRYTFDGNTGAKCKLMALHDRALEESERAVCPDALRSTFELAQDARDAFVWHQWPAETEHGYGDLPGWVGTLWDRLRGGLFVSDSIPVPWYAHAVLIGQMLKCARDRWPKVVRGLGLREGEGAGDPAPFDALIRDIEDAVEIPRSARRRHG